MGCSDRMVVNSSKSSTLSRRTFMAQDAHRNRSPSRTSDSRSQRSHTTSASSADTSALIAAHVVHRKSLPFRTLAVPPQRSQWTSRPPFDVDRGFGCMVRLLRSCGRRETLPWFVRGIGRGVRPGRISRSVRPTEQGGRGRMRERRGTSPTSRGQVDPASRAIRALARRACLTTSTRAGCGSNQARSASTGQSPGRARSSATGRSFGRTPRSARTALVSVGFIDLSRSRIQPRPDGPVAVAEPARKVHPRSRAKRSRSPRHLGG
jgi:hypothetical protein